MCGGLVYICKFNYVLVCLKEQNNVPWNIIRRNKAFKNHPR